jgi:hypothetical protein
VISGHLQRRAMPSLLQPGGLAKWRVIVCNAAGELTGD